MGRPSALATAAILSLVLCACGGGADTAGPVAAADAIGLPSGEPMEAISEAPPNLAPAAPVAASAEVRLDTVNSEPKEAVAVHADDESPTAGWANDRVASNGFNAAGPERQVQGVATRADAVSAETFTPSGFTGRAWYVDSLTGSDSNPGTQDKPWRTLAKASTVSYAPGDALLLKCGSGWREPLTLATASPSSGGLLVSAYGDCSGGRRPVIRPTLVPSNWARDAAQGIANNIFRTQASGTVGALIVDGAVQPSARIRNSRTIGSEFSSSAGAAGATAISLDTSAKSLSAAAMIGATLHVRTRPWIVESAKVTSFDPTTATATLDSGNKYVAGAGSGYIVEGRDWMVDEPGEWAQEPATGAIAAWLPANVTPSSSTVELATQPYGVRITGIGKVVVERLRIEFPTKIGVEVRNSPGFVVRDVQVMYPGEVGIQVEDIWAVAPSIGGTVERSVVVGAGSAGIRMMADEGAARSNTVRDTGLANRAAGSIAGIYMRSSGGVIERNTVVNSAYSAVMYFNKGGGRLSDNSIDTACVRLSDCGAIYASGSTSSMARGQILRNAIRNVRPNRDGAVGGAIDLVAGIYLDEYANQFDVVGNMISDTGVGINLHKAQNNNILDNRVWLASDSGIRAQSEVGTSDPLRGNVVKGNTVFMSRHFDPAIGAGLPQRRTSAAQEWIHPVSASNIFTGANPNIVSGNKTVLLGSPVLAQWILRSGSVQKAVGYDTWKLVSNNESLMTPLDAKMAKVNGSQLITNGSMEPSGSDWRSYFYTASAGGNARLVSTAACQTACLEFLPVTDLDVVYQGGISGQAWSPTSAYFLSYTVKAGSQGGQMKVEVRKDFSPFAVSGYIEDRYELLAQTLIRQEAFFRPADASNLRLSIKGKPGSVMYVDDVQLVKVESMTLFEPRLYSAHLVNTSAANRSFSCAEAGLATCDVVDDSGRSVGWPISVPAGASKMVYAVDGSWTQRR